MYNFSRNTLGNDRAMMRKPNLSATAPQLRRRAKARLRERQNKQGAGGRGQGAAVRSRRSAADPRRLLHELQVHQVELEMQNAELQKARDDVEAGLERYTDLYDFAPVGYFSLDDQGRILEGNLTGAAMFGIERSRLILRRFQQFVAPADRPNFLNFLERVFAAAGKMVCEATLLKADGATFWADLQAVWSASLRGTRKWCRVAVSDITSRKRAEEAQRRTDALTVTNLELRREIIRRREVENALKKSEQRQSRLLEQSRQMQEQLRHLSHQILQAQEDERKRISRELHDVITQTLVGISVHLETLSQKATVYPGRLKQKIARTQRLVEKSVNIVHQFARELRPTGLDDLGLISTLHSFMKDFMKRTGIRVGFTTFAGVEQLNSARRTVLYRVVQAALTNVAQHTRASRVEVTIRKLRHRISMKINDDGTSFDVGRMLHSRKNKRLGLLGMKERMEMVGGTFSIASAPGKGTTIEAQIPFGKVRARTGR
jgi:PAS domain S-box-containing protein